MENSMQENITTTPVLVTGATGKQGGAVTRSLLKRGISVRALVRDPKSPQAEALSALGVQLVQGDLNDIETLRPPCEGVRAVFSVQTPDLSNPLSDSETVQGKNLVDAARGAGVSHFVQTSTSGTKEHRNAPGWSEGRWHKTHMGHYWERKAKIEGFVRDAGFPTWTILRPAFFMENFIRPSFLFANWTEDRLLTAIRPDVQIAMAAVQDIGSAGAASIADPNKFNRAELELAGDRLNMRQIAVVLSDTMGIPLSAPDLTVDEAIAQGMMPVLVFGQEWTNDVAAPARPEFAHALGLPTTSFATWAHQTLAAQVPVLV